ncbi:hypothetical protein CASFOL_023412 [Castilleja foliolosa]|uniref:Uncharacterized protein n=1 Tax=Castilleja foliolosa TaxID=1961234 RepID=A0ABD3CKH1_9LAMI
MAQSENRFRNGAQATACLGDEFEHVPLRQRLKLLLAKREDGHWDSQAQVKVEYADNHVESSSTSCMNVSSVAGVQAAVESELSIEYLDELEHVVLKERLRMLLARLKSKCLGLTSTMLEGSAIPIAAIPPGYDELQDTNVAAPCQLSFGDFGLVKSEIQTTDDAYEDELDHMLLRDRMKLFSSRDGPGLVTHQSSKRKSKTEPSAFGCKPVASTPAPSFKVNRPRKRRRTVTDSIETAMEEDAPGLLKVLVDKGVLVDEIKLYGEPESNEALEDSSTTENFAELEEIISKLFSQRDSLLKLAPLRCTKGEKASYCLECLLSLVEQARYLRFRNWPVEWGWCRDLQSFIFVFERHNRLVLERPEYGYATYFFELADSLPINWQIRRLIIAMKLTNCSRITILENKALMVGDDLTDGEARVLMEYGWKPNTGLGTMLNYYDRVVHDRKNESDRSDWKSKIGKFLMDGYNGGTIVSAGIPIRAEESDVVHPVEIKLELI